MDGRERARVWRAGGEIVPKRLTAAQVAAMQARQGGAGVRNGTKALRRAVRRHQEPSGSAYNLPVAFFGTPAFQEWQFHPTRRWRFDWAFPEAKLALEIEGGQWVNGRHNRAAGQIADLAKYSEAAILGWRIVYATPAEVENGTALDRVLRALNAAQHDPKGGG